MRDFLASYVPRIREVDAAQLQAIARKYFDPKDQSIIVVGDGAAIAGHLVGLQSPAPAGDHEPVGPELEEADAPLSHRRELVGGNTPFATERGGAPVVLGKQRRHLDGAERHRPRDLEGDPGRVEVRPVPQPLHRTPQERRRRPSDA